MGKLRKRKNLLMSMLLLVVVATSIASILSYSLAGGGDLAIVGYNINGQTVEVQVHNSTRQPIMAMVTAEADVGGVTETGYSFAGVLPAGQTVTLTIYFSAPVVSITEGPDPIPQ